MRLVGRLRQLGRYNTTGFIELESERVDSAKTAEKGIMQKLALVGLGASGLFALTELAGAGVEVHVFDVGPVFEKRYACPIDQGKLSVCPPKACGYCAPGQSAGSWNDFKVILSASPVIGGRLYDLIGQDELQQRLDKVKDTILRHAPVEIPVVTPHQDDLEWIKRKPRWRG